MKINIKTTNRILWGIGICMVVAAAVACLFLNEAQRIVVAAGLVLGVVNLAGLFYFFNKNATPRRRR